MDARYACSPVQFMSEQGNVVGTYFETVHIVMESIRSHIKIVRNFVCQNRHISIILQYMIAQPLAVINGLFILFITSCKLLFVDRDVYLGNSKYLSVILTVHNARRAFDFEHSSRKRMGSTNQPIRKGGMSHGRRCET